MRRKRYAYGAYIQNPMETIQDYNLQYDKQLSDIESMLAPIEAAGQLGLSVGSLMGNINMPKKRIDPEVASLDGSKPLDIKMSEGELVKSPFIDFAFGGSTSNRTIPIEAEGGETVKTPDGTLSKLYGPSHSQGGIPIDVPEGTEIFSKNPLTLRNDGLTPAEASIERERHRNIISAKLKKAISKLPKSELDILARNTGNRLIGNAQKDLDLLNADEESDIQFGEELNALTGQLQKARYGASIEDDIIPFVSRLNGTRPLNINNPVISRLDGRKPLDINISEGTLAKSSFNPVKRKKPRPYFSNEDLDMIAEQRERAKNYLPTAGDALGMTGSVMQAVLPLMNTYENRQGDTITPNFFQGVGREALRSYDRAAEQLNRNADSFNNKFSNMAYANQQANRRNSFGINQMRAMDTMALQQSREGRNQVMENLMNSISQNQLAKAQAQASFEQAEREGALNAYNSNEAKRDAFYNARAEGLKNLGLMTQSLGQDVNALKKRGDDMNLFYEIGDMKYDRKKKKWNITNDIDRMRVLGGMYSGGSGK